MKQNSPETPQKTAFLPRLSADRPVTVTVGLLALIVLGFISYTRIPLEMFPKGFSNPNLGVWVPYSNANPNEIEEQIAKPMEEELRTIPGIKEISTHSGTDGCWTGLEFSRNSDMDVIRGQLRDRLERVRSQLPQDIDRIYINNFGNTDMPIMFMSISYPDNYEDTYYATEQFLQKPLERIDGVAKVTTWGSDAKSIRIRIDQEKVKAMKVNLFDVITELQNDNFAMSSGWVYDGDKKFTVRSMARFTSLEDIKKLPINKLGLTVDDIAEVTYDAGERKWRQFVNRKPATLVGIFKESLANTVEISERVDNILFNQILKQPAFKGAEVNVFFSSGEMIKKGIGNLEDTALWGGLFAIMILMFFLKNYRMTLIMMCAIPLSVVIALILLYFMGWSLNIFTLMGFMISVGMVVDNGIVVLENIVNKQLEGKSRREASIFGASEVNLAIIMATLTTICVFGSLLFDNSGADGGFFMRRIGVPIVLALLGSLFVALVLIPLATTHLSNQKPSAEGRLLKWVHRHYRNILDVALKRRIDVYMGVLILIAITIITFQNLTVVDQQSGDISDFQLIFNFPGNITEEETHEYMTSVQDTIYNHFDRYNLKVVEAGYRRTHGRIRVYITPSDLNKWYHQLYRNVVAALPIEGMLETPRDSIIADLKRRIPKKPGIKFGTSWRSLGDNQEGGFVSIMLYGDDSGKLMDLSREVERRMMQLPGVLSVETERETGNDEVQINMDREKMTRNGINPNQVAYTLMYAVRGFNLPRFQTTEKEVQVHIQLEDADRENLTQIKNMTFVNNTGQSVPLAAIANFDFEKGFGNINRRNGKTYVQVKAQTQFKDLGTLSTRIDEVMKGFPLPYGYRWEKGSRFSSLNEQNSSMGTIMLIALILVFLVMAILFESWIYPLSVMLTIPLAFCGAVMALFITGTPMDAMAIIGMVILVGVVVNNGIIIVDTIIRKRKLGLSRHEAVVAAGENRLRPILMTSFTTIAGLAPMAIGTAELFNGFPYAPMGRAIIGGILVSSVLTLVVVPAFYCLFDDLTIFLKRFAGWFRRGTQQGGRLPEAN